MMVILLTFVSGCTKDKDEDGGGSSATGVWQRYGSPKGYQTDLAVGNIPGEPSNRVYMCEHPGSPSVGLYKGTISGTTITWDANHGLPDADFAVVGSERTLYFGVGALADAGKYKKGVWTNTCGELKKDSKNIYYKWQTDATCSIPSTYYLTWKQPDLPTSLTKNQLYGPMAASTMEVIINNSGSSPSSYYKTLEAPAAGYKRIYTHTVFSFSSAVNRCTFSLSNLTYVDQPL